MADGELDGVGEVGDGNEGVWIFKDKDCVIATVDKNQFFVGVDEPAHLGAVVEAVEDVANDFGLALFRGENLDGPVGGNEDLIDNFAVAVALDSVPGEDHGIRDDRSVPKGAAQFGEGSGNAISPQCLIHCGDKVSLDGAMFCLGHGFLDDLAVDEFAGGFGVGQLEEFVEGEGFEEGLDHGV